MKLHSQRNLNQIFESRLTAIENYLMARDPGAKEIIENHFKDAWSKHHGQRAFPVSEEPAKPSENTGTEKSFPTEF